MRWRPIAVVPASGLFIGASGASGAVLAQGDGKMARYIVGDLQTGYTYATPETPAVRN